MNVAQSLTAVMIAIYAHDCSYVNIHICYTSELWLEVRGIILNTGTIYFSTQLQWESASPPTMDTMKESGYYVEQLLQHSHTGAIELILIPFGAHSMERLLLRFSMADLAAPECLEKKKKN